MMSAHVQLVTPDWAGKVLEAQKRFHAAKDVKQRPLSQANVKKFARLMGEGRWKLNGEPIQFAGERLLNGQHRLNAVVLANVSAHMLVVEGVEADVFDTIDQGKQRSTQDLLTISGLPNSSVISQGVRVVYNYERHGLIHVRSEKEATHAELVEMVSADEQGWQRAAQIGRRKGQPISPALAAAFYYLVSRRYEVECISFLTNLTEGINLRADQPVRLLRERLLNDKNQRARLHRSYIGALLFKAWNYEILNKPLGTLRLAKEEAFPVLVR